MRWLVICVIAFSFMSGGVLRSATASILVFQPGVEGIDAQIEAGTSSNQRNTNYGTSGVLGVAVSDHSANTSRSLIKFDISSLPSDPLSVTLELFGRVRAENNPPTGSTQFFAITQDWNETTVTWNNQPNHTGPAIGVVAPAGLNGFQSWYSLDITTVYNGWKADPANNFGLKLVSTHEFDNETGIRYTSSDGATAGNRPRLLVEVNPVPEPNSATLTLFTVVLGMLISCIRNTTLQNRLFNNK